MEIEIRVQTEPAGSKLNPALVIYVLFYWCACVRVCVCVWGGGGGGVRPAVLKSDWLRATLFMNSHIFTDLNTLKSTQ